MTTGDNQPTGSKSFATSEVMRRFVTGFDDSISDCEILKQKQSSFEFHLMPKADTNSSWNTASFCSAASVGMSSGEFEAHFPTSILAEAKIETSWFRISRASENESAPA